MQLPDLDGRNDRERFELRPEVAERAQELGSVGRATEEGRFDDRERARAQRLRSLRDRQCYGPKTLGPQSRGAPDGVGAVDRDDPGVQLDN